MKLQTLIALLGITAASAQVLPYPSYPNPENAWQWDQQMKYLYWNSVGEQAAKDAEVQARLHESAIAAHADELKRQQDLKAQTDRYNNMMRYANWLERATNAIPNPAKLSELYLKQIGDFKVTVETNLRAGTINYYVSGCQKTNIAAVFDSLKQMPNRTRISQGTNLVTISIKLPTL